MKDSTLDSRWEKVANEMRQRSMWMLHYCTGCGAIELPPTMTARWDMERFGITPFVTPRQADILLVTGYVALKTLRRIVTIYEQMPDPKYVVGFGSCTINGGIYWDSYNVIKKLEHYIPIDLYIAGCMPRPESIISGFEKLMDIIKTGKATGWKKYIENNDYYKTNQRTVLGEK